MQNPLRNIPSVNELLESPPLQKLVDRASHNVVVSGVRAFLEDFRDEVQSAAADMRVPTAHELAERIADWIVKKEQPALQPVINATGILLHTGLGRAPWPPEAVEAVAVNAPGYCSVELDLRSGQRSQRVLAVEQLLRQLTGAEAACVVNNNAAATLLTLTALAKTREVVVSRGQLIEIGGSFRLPDVMSSAGAVLREVGTTNKTRIEDYEAAIGEQTAALLRVHTSNFQVVGFTAVPTLEELAAVGRRHQLPVIDDIGSGALIDFAQFSVQGEPVAARSIQNGADLVLFSGDKLLGGPQCGIIVGRRALVERISAHPMMRALRLDKALLAGLAATLRLYRDPKQAQREIPLLALLATSLDNLRNRAERLAPQLGSSAHVTSAEAMPDVTYLGGGSVPTQQIPTWCIALTPAGQTVNELARELRSGHPAVVGRIHQDRLLLDLRSVLPSQDAQLVDVMGNLPAKE